MNEIKEILISKLFPHPKNPRQDLGDLTELTESIKAVGIAQPPTVVKTNEMDTYTIIMGHRRVAAAKLAGIEKITCIVAELTKQQQLEMMLMENIQRSNLTILEEADGYQMVLDLGVSVKDLAKNTGISETTIRKKTSILKNDREKLEASVERGGTLKDYLELEKLTDSEAKAKVLDSIGTNNFANALYTAQKAQETAKILKTIEAKLNEWATKTTEEACAHLTRTNISFGTYYADKEISKPADADKVKYFYYTHQSGSYGFISVFKEAAQEASDDSKPDPLYEIKYAANEWLVEQEEIFDDMERRHKHLRKEFLVNYPSNKIGAHIVDLIRFLICAIIYGSQNRNWFYELSGVKLTENKNEWLRTPDPDSLVECIKNNPERMLLMLAYTTNENLSSSYFTENDNYFFIERKDNEKLDKEYEFLEKLGYRESQEEKDLRSGKLIEDIKKKFIEKFPELPPDEERED